MKDFRPVATMLTIVAIFLIALMMCAYVTTIESGGGWLTVTIAVNEQIVAVKSICMPGCVQYPVPASGGGQ